MPEKRKLAIIGKYVTLGTRVAAGLVIAGALSVLLGWAVSSELLKSTLPGFAPTNPTTAVLFLLSAVSLRLATAGEEWRGRIVAARLIAAVALLVSLLSLLAYLLDWQPLVDSMLFAERLNGNRMAPNSAVHFILIALAILLVDVRLPRLRLASQGFACAAIIASSVWLLGYLFGARNLYGVDSHMPMGINAAILFSILSLGVLCMRPKEGVPLLLAASDLGSVMARRLFPAAVGITCLLGFLRLLGERAGFYQTEFGVAAMVILNIVMLAAAVLYTAVVLNRIDAERRLATAALQESAERYRFLAESMPGIMWTATAAGDFDYCNQRWYAYTGLSFEQTRGNGWLSVLHPDDRDACASLWSDSLKSGTSFEMEVRIRKAISDEYRWHLMRGAARWTAEGELAQWVGTCTDVDDQKRAAQALAELNSDLEERINQRVAELADTNRDLQQKNQENEMFVYSVSHDLRSPLVNLQGFSKELGLVASDLSELMSDPSVPDSVRQRADAMLNGELRESIRFIQTAVTRLSNIIDALLRLSRVGRVEYHFQLVDMNVVIGRIVESMQATLIDKGAAIELDRMEPCYGDATAIEQLFANLIGNAIKYLDPERPGKIEIGQGAEQGHWHTYFVRDNGLGIPSAYQDKVFDTFKRFHPHSAPGDGMGLAIVRRIVERHAGTIRVESKEGCGSTFFVTLSAREIAGGSVSIKHALK